MSRGKKSDQERLFQYARTGDIESMKGLNFKKIDIDKHDDAGCTALIYAARNNKVKVVEYLVEKAGADANYVNNRGKTALSSAAQCGNDETVQYLLNHPEVYVGKSELTLIAEYCNPDITLSILDSRKTHRYKFIEEAIRNGSLLVSATQSRYYFQKSSVTLIKTLIDNKSAINSHDGAALHNAINSNNFETVDMLISAGSNINGKDEVIYDRTYERISKLVNKIDNYLKQLEKIQEPRKKSDKKQSLSVEISEFIKNVKTQGDEKYLPSIINSSSLFSYAIKEGNYALVTKLLPYADLSSGIYGKEKYNAADYAQSKQLGTFMGWFKKSEKGLRKGIYDLVRDATDKRAKATFSEDQKEEKEEKKIKPKESQNIPEQEKKRIHLKFNNEIDSDDESSIDSEEETNIKSDELNKKSFIIQGPASRTKATQFNRIQSDDYQQSDSGSDIGMS